MIVNLTHVYMSARESLIAHHLVAAFAAAAAAVVIK